MFVTSPVSSLLGTLFRGFTRIPPGSDVLNHHHGDDHGKSSLLPVIFMVWYL
jgi:hypothetical protein